MSIFNLHFYQYKAFKHFAVSISSVTCNFIIQPICVASVGDEAIILFLYSPTLSLYCYVKSFQRNSNAGENIKQFVIQEQKGARLREGVTSFYGVFNLGDVQVLQKGLALC